MSSATRHSEWGPAWTEGWAGQAACADPSIDPEIFYPPDQQGEREAKAVCARCPVAGDCMDFILACEPVDFRAGVWGGLSAQDRRDLFRRQSDTALAEYVQWRRTAA